MNVGELEEFEKDRNVIMQKVTNFMAKFGIYGFMVRTNGKGDFESSLELDPQKARKWTFETF